MEDKQILYLGLAVLAISGVYIFTKKKDAAPPMVKEVDGAITYPVNNKISEYVAKGNIGNSKPKISESNTTSTSGKPNMTGSDWATIGDCKLVF